MRRYFLLLFCLIQFACFAQSSYGDSQKIHKTGSSSSQPLHRDSGYSRVEFRNNQLELKRLVDNMHEQEKKKQRRTYTHIILAAILLTIIIIVIIRRIQNRKDGN